MAFMGSFGFWCGCVFDTPRHENIRLAESSAFVDDLNRSYTGGLEYFPQDCFHHSPWNLFHLMQLLYLLPLGVLIENLFSFSAPFHCFLSAMIPVEGRNTTSSLWLDTGTGLLTSGHESGLFR